MIFGLLYFCVVILCVNRSRSSFILYRIVKRHSRQSNVRRIWTCADNVLVTFHLSCVHNILSSVLVAEWQPFEINNNNNDNNNDNYNNNALLQGDYIFSLKTYLTYGPLKRKTTYKHWHIYNYTQNK